MDLLGMDLLDMDLLGMDLLGMDLLGMDLLGMDLRGVDWCVAWPGFVWRGLEHEHDELSARDWRDFGGMMI